MEQADMPEVPFGYLKMSIRFEVDGNTIGVVQHLPVEGLTGPLPDIALFKEHFLPAINRLRTRLRELKNENATVTR